ncbi:hypothetical protein ABEW34_01915 [Paenibacillus algorifonticola]|uniref:hypothetical protein n=1 Tax=Paenibacillus algorifonticola TaxID=684063 RepID=UPI003D2CE76F
MFNPYDYYITPEEYEEAAKNSINRENLNQRIRSLGWTKKQAMTKEVRIYTNRSAIRQIADEHGIPYCLMKERIYLGWSQIKAATQPVRTKSELVEHARRLGKAARKYPIELAQVAEQNGIPYSTFIYRMRKGWSPERASTLPPSRSNVTMRLKEIHGDNYFSELNNRF